MRLRTGQSWFSLAVVLTLCIILILLAFLQYRWSGKVSEAERARMQSNLNTAISQFRSEFSFELQRLSMAFQFDPADFPGRDWSRYAQRYDRWLLTAPYARLVANIFIWDVGTEASSQLLRLNPATLRFEPTSWPPSLEIVRANRLLTFPQQLPPGFRPNTCVMLEQIPLLLLPLVHFSPPSEPTERRPQLIGYFMIELSPDVLRRELLPELARKYFGGEQGFIYQIAIVRGAANDRILYQSDPSLTPEFFSSPDVKVGLLSGPRDFSPHFAGEGPPAVPPPGDDFQQPPFVNPQNPSGPRQWRPRTTLVVLPPSDGDNWTLLARHTEGTLGQVVAGQRRRNLAISFGTLLLLALSMAMIMLSTRRAQRLARLQMNFVAGVSHELRTPLSVICSAADNLAEGVVAATHEQVRQYGDLIRQEGRRLAGMVEQILLFAKSRDGRMQYNLRPVQAGKIVESVMAKSRSMIERAGFTVEKQIEPNLPPVRVDDEVLSQCIENLLSNALKYGGVTRWMKVSARSICVGGASEVQITVEDKGIGITPEDLPHIFDPFYRGAAATGAQIHGSGLGLNLARQGIAAMGGRISVRSTPDEGSAFTIHLPGCSKTEEADLVQALKA
ncbi:MAG TPA: HAMP domain-containing sensor histidine kinase [Acidobacteriota bacterium]|nr:HAMP domain-containing sensor histidine kinase [Acidobacteriota bacterium]